MRRCAVTFGLGVAAVAVAGSISGCSLSLPDVGLSGLAAGSRGAPSLGAAAPTHQTRAGGGAASGFVVAAAPTATADAGARPQRVYPRAFALVIGNDDYTSPGWPRLKQAVNDAQAVRTALQSHGFEVQFAKNLKSRELRELLEDFFITRGADREAGLVLWFAGHGTTVNGEGYIVPVDAPPADQDAPFRRAAISMREFGRYMREARASHVLSVFDSCFSGSVFKTGRAGRPPAIERALAYPVRQYISAGDHTQEVADNGEFQKLFVDAIMGREPMADHDRNGYLTARELGIFMQTQMANRSDGRQAPQFGELAEGEFDRGDFVFNIGAPRGSVAALARPGLTEMATAFRAPRRDILSNMRSTKVFVGNVVGANGDGNIALREAMAKKLAQSGFEVLDVDSEYAFKVQGVVSQKNAGLLMEAVTVRWIVMDPKRVSLGQIDHVTETFTGSRSRTWGTSAGEAADFAVKRMSRLLVRG